MIKRILDHRARRSAGIRTGVISAKKRRDGKWPVQLFPSNKVINIRQRDVGISFEIGDRVTLGAPSASGNVIGEGIVIFGLAPSQP